MKKKRLINKKLWKLVAGKCRICKRPVDPKAGVRDVDYYVLDVHRIIPGEDSGEYTADNIVICCVLCHRLIHAKQIIIDKWYMSTAGRMLRITRGGQEEFV